MNWRNTAIAILGATALILAGCGSSDNPTTTGGDTTAGTTAGTTGGDTAGTTGGDTAGTTGGETTGGDTTGGETTGGDDVKTPEDYGCEPHPGDPIEGEMGACQNTVDGCILGELDATAAATSCGLGCLGAGPECSGECMAKTGLSEGCGGCFSAILGCVFDNCIGQCATAPGSDECSDCREEFCNADFETCSGLPTGSEEPEADAGGTDG